MSTHHPIFRSVFGDYWDRLPPVMHKHYANRAYTTDQVTVEGIMAVEIFGVARLLTPFMRWSGALVPYAGDNIPVTVHFRSEPDSDAFRFDRIFHIPNRAPYHFRSRMLPYRKHEIIEYMPVGIGWRAAYGYDGKRVTLSHRGYGLRLWGRTIILPLTWLFGAGDAWEEAVDENRFRMRMTIRHWLFGEVYAYSGEFTVKEVVYA